MEVKLIAFTDNIEELLEYAGRICYRSKSKGQPDIFLKGRINAGHESILEHASFTFEISGISRACSHQLVRHRIASYSQESQRYCDMSDLELVVPPSITDDINAIEVWGHIVVYLEQMYSRLIELRIPKEDARFILPNATVTRLVMTMNCRELRHFFKVRLHKSAQWEIRELAEKMLDLVSEIAPSVFEDIC